MTEVLFTLAGFAAGFAADRAARLIPSLRKRKKAEPDDQVLDGNEQELANDVYQDIKRYIVEQTVEFKSQAQSDNPFIQQGMEDLAKTYLISNRHFFDKGTR